MARPRPKIVWSRLAELDLESAHAYLAELSPEAARRFASGVLDTVDRLQRHPESGPVATELFPQGRYRQVSCGRYRIIHRIADGAVVLLRVWDARRDPGELTPE